MRRGAKLAAVALAATILPVPSAHADDARVLVQLVRELSLSGDVSHTNPNTGKTTKGTMTFSLRTLQGIEVYKIPTAESLDGVDREVFLGLVAQPTGLARTQGCLTIKIAGVTDERNKCELVDAQMNADPAMMNASFVATIAQGGGWKATVNGKVEGTGTPVLADAGTGAQPELKDQSARCVKSAQDYRASVQLLTLDPMTVKPGTRDDLNLVCTEGHSEALVAHQAQRDAILVIGSVFDERPSIGLITMLPATFKASIRTRVEVGLGATRGPAVCFAVPFAIVIPAGCYG